MAFKVEKDDFSFSGNKVTNASFLIEVLENCDNNDRLNSDADVKQCLFNTMLFSEVIIDKRGNKYEVDLKERFYIIPIPMITYSSTAWSVGVAVADMNTFGNGEVLALGVGYGSRGGLLLVNYFVPRAFGTNWYYNLSTFNNATEYTLYGENLETIYAYTSKYNNLTILGGYSFDRNRKISAGLYGAWVSYSDLDDYIAPPSNNYLSFLGSVVWGIKEFKLFYSEGWSLVYNYRGQLTRTNPADLARIHNFNGNYTYPVTNKFIVDGGFKLGRVLGGNFSDALTVGGSEGYRGIPFSGIWTDYVATSYINANYLLKSFKYFALVGGGFLDLGYFKYMPPIADDMSFYSYGLSISAYLKKVYIPGFGLNIGANNPIDPFFVQIFIGLPF